MTNKKLTFKKLQIERKDYGFDEGKLKGRIAYTSDNGFFDFVLKEHHIDKIFEIVSQAMIEVTQEMSDELMADIVGSLPNPDLLENGQIEKSPAED